MVSLQNIPEPPKLVKKIINQEYKNSQYRRSDMARYTEAQNKATQKYIKNNYDNIVVRVPKGKREEYKAHAEALGKSLNQLIIDLLNESMKG